jgi:chlorite dismutase
MQDDKPAARQRTVDLDPSGQVGMREPDRVARQFLNYAFYKVSPEYRRQPRAERKAAGEQFVELIKGWSERDDFILRTYSLVGVRGDVDFMLWRICKDLGEFQRMQAQMNGSALGAWLTQPYNYLSMQKRS